MAKHEIGGQAVIDGVMMRGKTHYVVAIRKNKKIIHTTEPLNTPYTKYPFLKWPFFRGIVALIQSLTIGIKALNWSANQSADEGEELSNRELTLTFVTAFAFSIFLFIVLPLFLTNLLTKEQGFIFNLIDGLIRIAIFVVYILIISLLHDVKVLFQYHGAEHKAINCYEANKTLNPKNAKPFPTLHPRCGTAFIILVLVISILLFSLITDSRWYVKFLSRIILIPVIAGISYELLKLSAKFRNNPLIKILIAPGLLFQKLTTAEPTAKQLEVAITALKQSIKAES